MNNTPTVLIDDADTAKAFVEQTSHATRFAIDTEFHAESRYRPQLMLLQVGLDNGQTFVIDACHPELLDTIRPHLAAHPWVVHGGDHDIDILDHALGLLPSRIEDTQIIAGLVDTVWPASLATLLEQHLDTHIDKTQTLSDWSIRPLAEAQLSYAADDVRHLLPLRDALYSKLEALDRLSVLDGALDDWRANILRREPSPDAWRSLYQNAPTPETAAATQALICWRDRLAHKLDKPPAFIISDGALRRIAKLKPISQDDLATDRRTSAKLIQRHGASMIQALAHVTPQDVQQAKPILAGSPQAHQLTVLQAIVTSHCVTHQCAPNLLLPAASAHRIVANMPSAAIPMRQTLEPWRDALIGELLHDAIQGRVSCGLKIKLPGIGLHYHDI